MENSGTNQTENQGTADNGGAQAVPVSPFAPTPEMTEQQVNEANQTATQASEAAQPATAEPTAEGVTMADIPEPSLSPEVEEKPAGSGDAAAAEEKPAEKLTEEKPVDVAKINKAVADEVASLMEEATRPENAPLSTDVTIEALLEECVKHAASDLHLQVSLPPILRIDGVLRPLTTYPVLSDDLVQKLVFATLDEDQQKILLKDKEFDYSFAFGDLGRFRVNAFHEKGNMAAALRLIPNKIPSLDDLGLPGVIASFAEHPHGLVLVTGPTGSGKSTTLAALIDKINSEKAVHIITIEDPIEFTHHSKRSVVAQREVHYDTFSFAAALRSILREDPDVVLIGEMRDLETIQAAITVAETGHLVFATLHTNSAAQSIDRIIDVFPAHQQPQIRSQLANVLAGICSQRLVPKIDGGRVAVTEILVANSAVRAIIREGKTHQLDMAIQTGVDQGMQTMDRELARLVKAGTISFDAAHEYAVDTMEFERLARG